MVEYDTTSAKDISRLHQFGPKCLARYIPRLCLVCGRNLERRHYDRKRRWHQNSTPEGFMQRKCQRRWKVKISYSQSHMEQSKFLEEISVWEHPPWSGIAQTEERNRSFPRRIRRTLFSKPSSRWLNTGRCVSPKWFLVFYGRLHLPSSRWVKLYLPKENHFLFRWSASTWPEQHTRHLMYCWKNLLMITGTWMEKENCQMHGQAPTRFI